MRGPAIVIKLTAFLPFDAVSVSPGRLARRL